MQLKQVVACSTLLLVLLSAVSGLRAQDAKEAKEASEPEFIIVKYGSVQVKSPDVDGRVYIDGVYKGDTDRVIESVIAGERLISCQAGEKTVSGTFQVRKGATLRLEALFDAGKLVPYGGQHVKEVEKKKPGPPAQQKPRKVAGVKKADPKKDPAEERRKTHLNIMKIDYDITGSQKLKIHQTSNRNVISKYSSWKNTEGRYYRTKQGQLLCDKGPCEMTWSAKFLYADDAGATDALLLKWKETVFNGITPDGTSRQDLECCLNGECWKMKDTGESGKTREFEVGRYRLFWSSNSVLLRRADIMKEVLEAGRSLDDY